MLALFQGSWEQEWVDSQMAVLGFTEHETQMPSSRTWTQQREGKLKTWMTSPTRPKSISEATTVCKHESFLHQSVLLTPAQNLTYYRRTKELMATADSSCDSHLMDPYALRPTEYRIQKPRKECRNWDRLCPGSIRTTPEMLGTVGIL